MNDKETYTYEDILQMWLDSLGSRPYDYRPVSPIFLEDIGVDIKITNPTGIIVWLENGDRIIYYPNLKEKEMNNECMETL